MVSDGDHFLKNEFLTVRYLYKANFKPNLKLSFAGPKKASAKVAIKTMVLRLFVPAMFLLFLFWFVPVIFN